MQPINFHHSVRRRFENERRRIPRLIREEELKKQRDETRRYFKARENTTGTDESAQLSS